MRILVGVYHSALDWWTKHEEIDIAGYCFLRIFAKVNIITLKL
jgi:hypothetical protein